MVKLDNGFSLEQRFAQPLPPHSAGLADERFPRSAVDVHTNKQLRLEHRGLIGQLHAAATDHDCPLASRLAAAGDPVGISGQDGPQYPFVDGVMLLLRTSTSL